MCEEERQQAKQIVYGIIYGIGAKTLSEQLKVTESQAEKFMDNFKVSYLNRLEHFLSSNVCYKITTSMSSCVCNCTF